MNQRFNIHHGDCIQWAKDYAEKIKAGEAHPFHAMFADPPYHLTSITERFGPLTAAPARSYRDGAFSRTSKGFMGKDWDGGDLVFRPETWLTLASVLLPGGFIIMAMAANKAHRMAVAMEDAGLIVYPSIYNYGVPHPVSMRGWGYTSGFPKATNPSIALDVASGVDRVVKGERRHAPKFNAAAQGYREKDNGFNSYDRDTFVEFAPTHPLAQQWAGHRYGGQILKPALEPIIVAQRPYEKVPCTVFHAFTGWDYWMSETVVTVNAKYRIRQAAHGITIPDDCEELTSIHYHALHDGVESIMELWWGDELIHTSTKPYKFWNIQNAAATIAITGAGALNIDATRVGDEPIKINRFTDGAKPFGNGAGHEYETAEVNGRWMPNIIGDEAIAADYAYFMHTYGWSLEAAEALANSDPLDMIPKPSQFERNAGLEDLDVVTVDDGRQKPIDNAFQRGKTTRKNPHPTIKPITLYKILATLLLPPEGVGERRIVVPFSGSGSEMIGALLAGWDFVQGIELTDEYVPVATQRIVWWLANGQSVLDGQKPAPKSESSTKPAPKAAQFAMEI